MAQEVSVGYDWMQAAKDLAKAEKDLGVQKWVLITFYRKNEKGEAEKIFEYDLPRELWIKWNWVVNWRRAKLICMFPRGEVYNTMSFYDKRSGYETSINTFLGRLISAKAQATKVQRSIDNYIAWNRRNNMFFDENTDEKLIILRGKLFAKINNIHEAEERLKSKITITNS
jgi:hypothetical protein